MVNASTECVHRIMRQASLQNQNACLQNENASTECLYRIENASWSNSRTPGSRSYCACTVDTARYKSSVAVAAAASITMDRMGWMVRMHKDGLLDEPFLKNHTLPRVHVFLVIFHSTNHHRRRWRRRRRRGWWRWRWRWRLGLNLQNCATCQAAEVAGGVHDKPSAASIIASATNTDNRRVACLGEELGELRPW